MSGVAIALLATGALLLAEKAARIFLVGRFLRRKVPAPRREVRLVSILQPILGGDPLLADCLERNLLARSRHAREFLWLVDEDDPAGQRAAREVAARHPEALVRVIELPPPPDRCSPKLFKLIAAMEQARGDVVCVLDDDTMLPDDGLESCLPYLDLEGVGLAFGLPYYTSFETFGSQLAACFVNSHSLLTYLPYTYIQEPFTINGMFYAYRRDVYDAIGGFRGLEHVLADDFAVASRFRAHGLRLAQTPLRHPIRTHVAGVRQYLRLLHRWFIFPRETLLRGLPARELAISWGLGMVPVLAPLFFLASALVAPSPATIGLCVAYLALHFASFVAFDRAWLRRASPRRAWWIVPIVQLMLPFQVLAAVVAPQRIHWRGHVMRIERGGGFQFVKRRTGGGSS